MLQLSRFGHEGKRNKPGKSARFILELAKLTQMIDALFNGFDVPEEHGASAAATHLMPDPMHILPLFRGLFPTADLVTDDGIENFRTAPGQRVQTCVTQSLQSLTNGHFEDALRQVTN